MSVFSAEKWVSGWVDEARGRVGGREEKGHVRWRLFRSLAGREDRILLVPLTFWFSQKRWR